MQTYKSCTNIVDVVGLVIEKSASGIVIPYTLMTATNIDIIKDVVKFIIIQAGNHLTPSLTKPFLWLSISLKSTLRKRTATIIVVVSDINITNRLQVIENIEEL